MAILYQDQYKAMQGLGTDESYVLSHLACGYDISQIKNGLAKRGDRDTKDDVETIAERVYGKLGVNKLLKPSERWRKAGKICLAYSEMLREKRGPRPGKAPLDEEEPERVDDDEVVARDAGRFTFNGTKLGREEDADDEEDGTDGPPTPPADKPTGGERTPRADLEYDVEQLADKVPELKRQYFEVLKAAAETSDIWKIARETNFSESTVRAYIGKAAMALGVDSAARWERKFLLAVDAFLLAKSRAPKPADAPPPGEKSKEVHKTFALPEKGTVVTLSDPNSIEDVRVISAAAVEKYRDDGFALEHIVLPAQGGLGGKMYIYVKRTKPE